MPNTFLALLLAFSSLSCAFCAMGGGGMNIASRMTEWRNGGCTAKSYVQDGLVAMWDGIENAGWGVHDPAAMVWTDLTGNGYDVRTDYNEYVNGRFDDDSLVSQGKFMAYGSEALPQNDNYQIEFCAEFSRQVRNETICIFEGGGSGFAEEHTRSRTIVFLQSLREYNRNGIVFSTPGCIQTHNYGFGEFTLPLTIQSSTNAEESFINGIESAIIGTSTFAKTAYSRYLAIGGNVPGDDDVPSYSGNSFLPVGSKLHSLRVYGRKLSASERARNSAVDAKRFCLA